MPAVRVFGGDGSLCRQGSLKLGLSMTGEDKGVENREKYKVAEKLQKPDPVEPRVDPTKPRTKKKRRSLRGIPFSSLTLELESVLNRVCIAQRECCISGELEERAGGRQAPRDETFCVTSGS